MRMMKKEMVITEGTTVKEVKAFFKGVKKMAKLEEKEKKVLKLVKKFVIGVMELK